MDWIWDTCYFFPGFTRSSCASWLQAWGSIIAILAAVGIAAHQVKRARRERLLDQAGRYSELYAPALAMGDEAHALMKALYEKTFVNSPLPGYGANPVLWTECIELTNQVAELNAGALPTVVAITTVRRLKRGIRDASTLLQQLAVRSHQLERRDHETEAQFLTSLDEILGCVRTLRCDLVELTAPD